MFNAIRSYPTKRQGSASRQVIPLTLSCLGMLMVLCHHAKAATSTTLRVNDDRSSIVAITRRAGVLGFLGHDHGILATAWSAEVTYDADNPHLSRVAVTIPVRSLVIDTEEARRQAGLSRKGPKAADVRNIQQQMLSDRFLAAEQYPEITFKTSGLSRQAESLWTLRGLLTIRGTTHAVTFPLRLSRDQGTRHITGHFTLKQTDYGIEPAAIMGVVKVADEVDIRFDMWMVEARTTPK